MSGNSEDNEMEQIVKDFEDKVECIVDGGSIKKGIPSTIVKVENDDIKILRQGPISKQEIERRISKC